MRYITLVISIGLLLTPVTTKADDCASKLSLCTKYVSALESERTLLYDKINVLQSQRDRAESELAEATKPPLVPVWGWFIIGIAAGTTATILLK